MRKVIIKRKIKDAGERKFTFRIRDLYEKYTFEATAKAKDVLEAREKIKSKLIGWGNMVILRVSDDKGTTYYGTKLYSFRDSKSIKDRNAYENSNDRCYAITTPQGYSIIESYVDDNDKVYIIAKRAEDYMIAEDYQISDGSWKDSKNGFESLGAAQEELKKSVKTITRIFDSNLECDKDGKNCANIGAVLNGGIQDAPIPTKESGVDKIIYTMQSDVDPNLYFYIGKTYSMKEGSYGYQKFSMLGTSPEELKFDLKAHGWHQVDNGPAKVIDSARADIYEILKPVLSYVKINEVPGGYEIKYEKYLTGKSVQDILQKVGYEITNVEPGRIVVRDSKIYAPIVDADISNNDKKLIQQWWDAVEQWNRNHGNKLYIDNAGADINDLHSAMFDMLSELKKFNDEESKKLLNNGKRLYNKYAISSFVDAEPFAAGDKVLHVAQETKGTVEKVLPNGNLYIKWDSYIKAPNGQTFTAGEENPKITKIIKVKDKEPIDYNEQEAEAMLRRGVSAENSAIDEYEPWIMRLKELYNKTGEEKYLKAAKAIEDINNEEKKHVGEFSQALTNFSPEEGKLAVEGMEEVKAEDSSNPIKDVISDIAKLKNKLKNQPIRENFGQKEIRELKDKYSQYAYGPYRAVFDYINAFDEWCSNYTGQKDAKSSIKDTNIITYRVNKHLFSMKYDGPNTEKDIIEAIKKYHKDRYSWYDDQQITEWSDREGKSYDSHIPLKDTKPLDTYIIQSYKGKKEIDAESEDDAVKKYQAMFPDVDLEEITIQKVKRIESWNHSAKLASENRDADVCDAGRWEQLSKTYHNENITLPVIRRELKKVTKASIFREIPMSGNNYLFKMSNGDNISTKIYGGELVLQKEVHDADIQDSLSEADKEIIKIAMLEMKGDHVMFTPDNLLKYLPKGFIGANKSDVLKWFHENQTLRDDSETTQYYPFDTPMYKEDEETIKKIFDNYINEFKQKVHAKGMVARAGDAGGFLSMDYYTTYDYTPEQLQTAKNVFAKYKYLIVSTLNKMRARYPKITYTEKNRATALVQEKTGEALDIQGVPMNLTRNYQVTVKDEDKPDIPAKGEWVWDDVKYDWYDNGRKMYYTEIMRDNEPESLTAGDIVEETTDPKETKEVAEPKPINDINNNLRRNI